MVSGSRGMGISYMSLSFFKFRWPIDMDGNDTMLGDPPSLITDAENKELTQPVSVEKIRSALWAMAEDKTPEPDGFPLFFFRRYWPIIQVKMGEAVIKLFATGEMLETWLRIFVTLVSKRSNAIETCHYRSISLCTTLYKIYARLIVERMKHILPRLICPEQGAFIRGRSITDNIIIARVYA